MLVITIYEDGGRQKFAVHDCDGETSTDITEQYEVRQLAVEAEDGKVIAGWHVGRKVDKGDVLEELTDG